MKIDPEKRTATETIVAGEHYPEPEIVQRFLTTMWEELGRPRNYTLTITRLRGVFCICVAAIGRDGKKAC